MPEERRYDAVVIGSGPGGEGAAMTLAKAGRRVALVERYFQVGGGCTHWGTIPSKALRAAVQRLSAYRQDPLTERMGGPRRASFQAMMRTADKVIEQQVHLHAGFYERNDVDVLKGHARFVDPHTLEVEHLEGRKTLLRADHIVLAVGSRPYRPPGIDFSNPAVRDADTILQLEETPRHLIVYGAGVIGCEYATIFSNFGQTQVYLVDYAERIIPYEDDDVSDFISSNLTLDQIAARLDDRVASRIAGMCEVIRLQGKDRRLRK